jgi:antitoxin component of MazEF toxin-antitoxin module
LRQWGDEDAGVKVGNSLAVRLPAAVVNALQLTAGNEVESMLPGFDGLALRVNQAVMNC